MTKPKYLEIDLEIKDEFNNPQKLKLVDLVEEMETFGVFITPDGSLTSQFNTLLSKVRKWVRVLRVYLLPKDELYASINSTIMKTIEYPLVASTFIE